MQDMSDLFRNSVSVVSSTYLWVIHVGCNESIKITNVSGPRYEPCGIPADMSNHARQYIFEFLWTSRWIYWTNYIDHDHFEWLGCSGNWCYWNSISIIITHHHTLWYYTQRWRHICGITSRWYIEQEVEKTNDTRREWYSCMCSSHHFQSVDKVAEPWIVQ